MAARKTAAEKAAEKAAKKEGAQSGDQTKNQEGGDVKGDARNERVRAGRTSRRPEDQENGDRETAPADETRIWTNESKERWGDDQPSIADQLKSQMAVEQKLSEE